MSRTFNVLVTGAGALLGQGILRLLGKTDIPMKVYTADPNNYSSGHFLGHHGLTIPMAKSPDYMPQVISVLKEYSIDLILVGTDTELPIFAKHREELKTKYNCEVIVSSESCIDIANDKYLTSEFLREHDFPFAKSALATNKDDLESLAEEVGYPLFAKPRDGARSKGIAVIKSKDQLLDLVDPQSKMVVQEFLPDDVGEFTSGCLVVDGKCKSIVTLKRDLRDGNTYRTYRDSESSIYDAMISKIAEAYKPYGPVNFQFRVKNDQPVIFEINCRFSGTTPVRSFYGFNEVESICKQVLLNEEVKFNKLKEGVVFRTISDIFIENDQLKEFEANNTLKNPSAHFYNYKLD